MNAKVWDLFYEADKVREMLSRKIQEETLRTYLFTYSKVYNSISIVSRFFFHFFDYSLHCLPSAGNFFICEWNFMKLFYNHYYLVFP